MKNFNIPNVWHTPDFTTLQENWSDNFVESFVKMFTMTKYTGLYIVKQLVSDLISSHTGWIREWTLLLCVAREGLDRLHWDHTGWCYRPVVFQWQSSFNLHSWNTLDDQWKTIENKLETHWLPTICSIQVPGTLDCHWIAIELPLDQGKVVTAM